MPQRNPTFYTPLFESALENEIGLLVEVANPRHLRAILYECRKLADDPRFDEIIMFIPASNDRIFLARKSVELEP